MSTQVPPKKNTAFVFYTGLVSQADTKLLQANPTLATGDAKVSIDGGAFANLTTLPDVDPNSGVAVKVSLSADEMNGDNIQVTLIDASGAEWCDQGFNIQTVARQIDDLAFPTTSGRSIDVTATGAVGIDWANIENQATAVNLSATNIDVDQVVASVTADTAAVADSVAADGSRPSPHQALLMLTRFLFERAVVGVTMTVYKENGSTSNMTFTLNDSSDPTSITRAS